MNTLVRPWRRSFALMSPELSGLVWGFAGVLIFSLSVPFTRLAVLQIDPLVVGLGRAAVAAVLAAVLLTVTGQRRPTRAEMPGLVAVAAGVVIGFPAISSVAMRSLPSAHGAILLALAPLVTAAIAAWRAHEHSSRQFWVCSVLACLCVIGFAAWPSLRAGHGLALSAADLLMLLAVALAAVGYAEGGRVSRTLGGWQTICWGLVVSLPLLLPMLVWQIHGRVPALLAASGTAWLAVGYLALGSMFLGFFAWYHGLALGGIARVGQLQNLQLFLTLLLTGWLFHEPIPSGTWPVAAVVAVLVAIGRHRPRRA